MSRSEMLEKINEIFRDTFDDDALVVTEGTAAKDIDDWDSLMHITLISEIEKAFGMKFTMEEVMNMRNVGEMMEIIEKRQN
jgi:acyl carrier protein